MRMKLFIPAAALVVMLGNAAHAQWGDLKITFKTDKPVPRQEADGVAAANCGVAKVLLEDVVVDPKTLALANVVVYLNEEPAKIHESYQALANKKVSLDNVDCRFEPHITSLWTKQTLVIGNKDKIGHNSKVDAFDNTSINPLIPPGGSQEATFPNPELVPMAVSCNIHRWMKGYIVVKDHPYMGVSGKDGVVEIKNLPAGELKFRVWHETGYIKAEIDGEMTKKGRFTLDIPSKELVVTVPSETLN